MTEQERNYWLLKIRLLRSEAAEIERMLETGKEHRPARIDTTSQTVSVSMSTIGVRGAGVGR